MARRKKRSEDDLPPAQVIVAMILLGLFAGAVVLAAIKQFFQLHPFLGSAIAVALVMAAVLLIRARCRTLSLSEKAHKAAVNRDPMLQTELMVQRAATNTFMGQQPESIPVLVMQSAWTEAGIAVRMRAIDWYQFEKLNAAILAHEGWTVERKGGATPDGGVDLIAIKNEMKTLIQCKHWRAWKVQENVVREMLGSMTHFGVTTGAIHTLLGWTQPAAEFAAGHGILLADEHDLARRARASLTDEELARWLLDETHHCPKCEAEMVLRTGDFKSFWGCSRYPRCRATLREISAATPKA